MEHAVEEKPAVHMGLPLSNGKLAIWLFLVTEIMFFTGLIGVYIVLRNGTPTSVEPWPKPHQVHLIEWVGALNTFVLICSSLTVVLAHSALAKGNVSQAVGFITVTLALGTVFLVIKAIEYKAKFDHKILPGLVYDRVDGESGTEYYKQVLKDLEESDQIKIMIGLRDKFQQDNGKMPTYEELSELYSKKVGIPMTEDKEKRPSGEAHVTGVAFDPTYTFRPEMWPEVKEKVPGPLTIPPGPRNPVGRCWVPRRRLPKALTVPRATRARSGNSCWPASRKSATARSAPAASR